MTYFEKGYALIVGVASYDQIRPQLPVVKQDVQDVYDLLLSPAYGGYLPQNVRLLVDEQATSTNIRDGFSWLAEKTEGEGTAVVYFSGHGGRLTSGPDAGNYLLPYECRADNIPGTAISGAELTEWFRQIEADRLLVCFDSCFSGGAGETKDSGGDSLQFKSGLSDSYYEQLAKGKGRVIIASSRADETSLILGGMKNSLFTHYLLDALRGQAGNPENGYIGVFDLFNHISTHVPQRAEQAPVSIGTETLQQHPIFKAEVEDNFPIALYLGGEKSPPSQEPSSSPPMEIDTYELRKMMVNQFEDDDLDLLCEDVTRMLKKDGIDEKVTLEIVGGKRLENKCLNLIRYLDRRGHLSYLVTAVREARPDMI